MKSLGVLKKIKVLKSHFGDDLVIGVEKLEADYMIGAMNGVLFVQKIKNENQ